MKLFKDCGLAHVGPNDGESSVYTPAQMVDQGGMFWESKTPKLQLDPKTLLFETVLRNREHLQNLGFPFAEDEVVDFQRFPRNKEKESSLVYDFYRMTLLGVGGRASYVYIVLEVMFDHSIEITLHEAYGVFAISNPMPNLVPEYGWCNRRENWLYLLEEATSIEKSVSV